MPSTRTKSGLKHFIIAAAEKRRFDDVIECLKYVEFARDKDDLLTKGAGELAEKLAAMADAMAKPLAKREAK
jgi:hypothetical protein